MNSFISFNEHLSSYVVSIKSQSLRMQSIGISRGLSRYFRYFGGPV